LNDQFVTAVPNMIGFDDIISLRSYGGLFSSFYVRRDGRNNTGGNLNLVINNYIVPSQERGRKISSVVEGNGKNKTEK